MDQECIAVVPIIIGTSGEIHIALHQDFAYLKIKKTTRQVHRNRRMRYSAKISEF